MKTTVLWTLSIALICGGLMLVGAVVIAEHGRKSSAVQPAISSYALQIVQRFQGFEDEKSPDHKDWCAVYEWRNQLMGFLDNEPGVEDVMKAQNLSTRLGQLITYRERNMIEAMQAQFHEHPTESLNCVGERDPVDTLQEIYQYNRDLVSRATLIDLLRLQLHTDIDVLHKAKKKGGYQSSFALTRVAMTVEDFNLDNAELRYLGLNPAEINDINRYGK